jgi:methionine sulfoxide reductase heme-binding subunit
MAVTRRRVRHLYLVGFVGLACVATYMLSPRDAALQWVLSMGLGYASLVLLCVGLLMGPWVVIRGGQMPVSTMFRRDVGIWAALAGGLHVVFGLQSHMGGQILKYFSLAGQPLTRDGLIFMTANWLGLVATLILAGLLVLSNNWSLRGLGTRRWKFWQRFTYVLFVLTILHTVGYHVLEERSRRVVLLTLVAVAVVLIVQGLGFAHIRRAARPLRRSSVGGHAEPV